MAWQDDALKRLDELIEIGVAIPFNSRNVQEVDFAQFHGWQPRSVTALSQIVGDEHPYAKSFSKFRVAYASNRDAGLEILRALRADVEAGYLRRLSDTISAEVFSDFLDMAQHLLDQNYKDPAASLTGAVLEDGLRRIVRNHDITVANNDSLNSLADKCLQNKIFNTLVRREISAWTGLRDFADHGHFNEYTPQQVGAMIAGVRSFLANHLR